ncbi:MAG TPA: SDR family oxidoreductase [Solirubrobacteraceae bacterium]|nr:SDR family oxidoreductase [Solirubrobacteraceae bacterium]
MTQLEGKVALVTGGSRGIGAAVAERLAADGADVAVTYREREDSARGVTAQVEATGRRALALAADGTDADAVRAAVERTAAELGRLDILVANAGVYPYGPIDDVTLEELDRTLALHVSGVFVAAQAAARHMEDGGRIISIGSCFADRVPIPGITLYAMSKAALGGLTRGLARELGPRGITANVVHPGPTDTDMNPADGDGAPEQAAGTALGRFGTAGDVAATVAHLAGPAGRWVTGAEIAVDGGTNA